MLDYSNSQHFRGSTFLALPRCRAVRRRHILLDWRERPAEEPSLVYSNLQLDRLSACQTAPARPFAPFAAPGPKGSNRPEAAIRVPYSMTSSARARIDGGIVR